jgi:predicted RNase H-like HicB family nuclease
MRYHMRYQVILEKSDHGVVASVPGFPACSSRGATEQEALDGIAREIQKHIANGHSIGPSVEVREIEVPVGSVGPSAPKNSWPCQPGSAKDIPHWMAPDFNAPLEDFRAYMG